MNKRERLRKSQEKKHKERWINKTPIERVDKEEADILSLIKQIT